MSIYSKRFTPAKGNHWVNERSVTEETVQAWLAIFREDEPNVIFVATNIKPK